MVIPQNLISGKIGEDAATSYLKRKNYIIVSRNFRIRNGEIDIIAIDPSTDPQTLVFVEVKTREGNQFGTPFEAITYFKLKALTRSAQVFKLTNKNLPDLLRIDAISVEIGANGEIMNLEHIKNISVI